MKSEAIGTSEHAIGLRAFWREPAAVVRRCWAIVKRRRAVRRDIARLLALDDRMLGDIGLSRGDVDYAAWHGRLPERLKRTRHPAAGRESSFNRICEVER